MYKDSQTSRFGTERIRKAVVALRDTWLYLLKPRRRGPRQPMVEEGAAKTHATSVTDGHVAKASRLTCAGCYIRRCYEPLTDNVPAMLRGEFRP